MSLERKTAIIAGAPGIGKSSLFSEAGRLGFSIADSDSSEFAWLEPSVRNPDFPRNYIEHIQKLNGQVDVVCVSTHHEVRKALVDAGVEFTLVYPGSGQKDEYLRRLKNRPLKPGEDQAEREQFIGLLDANWEKWVEQQLPNQKHCEHAILREGEYLSDRISDLLRRG